MTNCNFVIPTYNRPYYLQRILDYYHKHGSDFNIIVADSSSEENKKLNKKIILSFLNLNIQYLDKYPKEINPHHKFADMVNYAKEKYCVFCADDDFVTPNGIRQSVNFLENNPDFTVAHGHYITFGLKVKNDREKQFYWETRYLNKSITFSDPKNRLIKHLSEYFQPTLYGVHRTDFLKMVYKEFLKSKTDPLLFGELLPSMLTLIYGKMKSLDVLYMARQDYSRCPGYWPSLRDFMNKGKYDEEYVKFKECLAVHLHKKSQLSIEKSKKVIDNAMSMYIKKNCSFSYKYFLVSKIKYILNVLHTPDWIYKKIRLLHKLYKLCKKLFTSQQTDIFSASLGNPSFKYYNDFEKIRTYVISYAKKR